MLIILIFTLIYLSFIFIRNLTYYLKWKGKKEFIDKQILEEKKRKENIKKEFNLLQDKDGGEKKLLEKYNVQKPGEKVIKIID